MKSLVNKIIVDFETYSPVSIDAGSVKYASHPEADIIMLAYGYEHVSVWQPQQKLPDIFYNPDIKLYAHNALFDYLIWHKIGVPKYGYPEISLSRWIDTQALANRYTFPGALEKVGTILGLDIQKSRRGKNLIKKISVPTKHGGRPVLGTHYSQADYDEFRQYAKTDVETTRELIKALPADELHSSEQAIWELTQIMNTNGLPVDVHTAERILSYIEGFAEDMSMRVGEITNGQVDKVTKVATMVSWIKGRGVDIDNLQAATVEKLLTTDIPSDVKELLELRQTLGRSSTAKYKKIMEMQNDGRVYNNLHFYGAGTGRWAGRGFQLHNLPRASVEKPEVYIDSFNNFEPVADPVNVAKALIRPMIKAPDGKQLIVSDYSAIENCLLVWVAQDEQALQFLRKDGDQYVDMACFMYQTTPDKIDKRKRLVGKIIVLGCGYGMGAKKFVATAETWGVELSDSEAVAAVNAYRAKYPMVKRMWYKLKDCAVDAITNPGRSYAYNNCIFRSVRDRNNNRWLQLTLPSGRALYYNSPYVEEDDFGWSPGHYGINPYSKKWSRLRLIPGRITENIIQALARDIMAYGLMNIHYEMPEIKLIGTVHDEAIGEIEESWITENTLYDFNSYLCALPPWAEGLPLKAAGYIAKRYRKD